MIKDTKFGYFVIYSLNSLKMKYGKLETYIDSVVARGRYYFTLDEVVRELNINHASFKRQILPLQNHTKVALIRKGFYAIVTPEYRKNGAPPVSHYINGMMEHLNRAYYVGLLNAAAWYGAAHQQPQKHTIIVNPPSLPAIRKTYARIDFVYKKEWSESDVTRQKTNAGFINVSSPELTALDLCYYPRHAGGINQVATVLEELADELDASKIRDLSERYNSTMAVQRLGFLLEAIHDPAIVEPLRRWLRGRKYYPTLLDPAEKSQNKVTGNIWKIIVNSEIETDL